MTTDDLLEAADRLDIQPRAQREHGTSTDVPGARDALAQIARHLTQRRGVPVTPWEVDNAIWQSVTGSTANY